jgi:hypothetical protein
MGLRVFGIALVAVLFSLHARAAVTGRISGWAASFAAARLT